MRNVDAATLRISRRFDGLVHADGPPAYVVRLSKHGAYDGPTYWSWQLARLAATWLWLILRRERRWDVIVERGDRPVWTGVCASFDEAIDLGTDVAAQLRADGRFRPPPQR